MIEPELIVDKGAFAEDRTILDPAGVAAALQSTRPPATPLSPPRPSSGDADHDIAAMPRDLQRALAHLQRRREAVAPSVPPRASLTPGELDGALAQRQRESGPPAPPAPASNRTLTSSVPDGPRARAYSVPSADNLGKELSPDPLLPTDTQPLGSPPSVEPAPKSVTAPLMNLGLKPGAGAPLSPMRTPSPMAIVGGSSLRIGSPDKQPGTRSQPSGDDVFSPSPLAMPISYPPKTATPSMAPSASNRPSSAGGASQSYERAFRQWSSPSIIPEEDAPPPSGPVTFQVYTAQDVARGRRPMRSMPAPDAQPKKLAARIGLLLLGGMVVSLTAAAVIAVSTEDPKPHTPTRVETAPEPPPRPVVPPEPSTTIPSTMSIGDPLDVPSASASAPAPPTPKPKSKSSGAPNAPASLRGIAPPPNPYGKSPR